MIQPFGSRTDPAPNTIALWGGALSNIPAGWVLCDGNNGTPNFLDQFPFGISGASSTPGSTVGQNSFSLSESQMPSHDHSGSTGNNGSHSHSIGRDSDGDTGDTYEITGSGRSVGTSTQSNHSHGASIDYTGGGSSIDNRPPYEEVAFIMKT